MNYIKGYRCTICGKFFETQDALLTCPECGEKGILDIEYDYDALKKVLKEEGYVTSVGDEGGFAPNVKNNYEAKFL